MFGFNKPRSFSLPFIPEFTIFTNDPSEAQTQSQPILTKLENKPRNEIEVIKLAEFKKLVKSKLDVPADYIDDDFFYLRWLRARSYNVDKALEMLRSCIEWREECSYLVGVLDFIPPLDALEQYHWKRLGTDPDGRPIYCFLTGRSDIKYLLDNNHVETTKKYLFKVLETVHRDCSEQRKKGGYGKAIGIVDLEGFTFAKALMCMELIHLAIYFARIFEANYPESIHRGYVINCPWYYILLFNAIKPFLSEKTLAKIQFFGSEGTKYLPAIQSAIPNQLIPLEYGGEGGSIEDFELIP